MVGFGKALEQLEWQNSSPYKTFITSILLNVVSFSLWWLFHIFLLFGILSARRRKIRGKFGGWTTVNQQIKLFIFSMYIWMGWFNFECFFILLLLPIIGYNSSIIMNWSVCVCAAILSSLTLDCNRKSFPKLETQKPTTKDKEWKKNMELHSTFLNTNRTSLSVLFVCVWKTLKLFVSLHICHCNICTAVQNASNGRSWLSNQIMICNFSFPSPCFMSVDFTTVAIRFSFVLLFCTIHTFDFYALQFLKIDFKHWNWPSCGSFRIVICFDFDFFIHIYVERRQTQKWWLSVFYCCC